MARNTTGLATPGDYSLGRGKLYYAAIDGSTGLPDDSGYRFLGNCPEFNVNIEREELEHLSSQTGVQTVDKTVAVSLKMSISFILDEINDQNLAMWLAGETADHTNPAIAGFAANVITESAVLGRWYDIVNSSGERAYDVASANVTVRRDPSGTPGTLVAGTDYDLDEKMGRIFLKTTSSTVVAGDTVDVALAADAGASAVQEVRGLTSTDELSGALKFIGVNPAASDKQREYQFHTVNISADGDYALIGDDWGQLSFSGSVESNELADSASPYVRVRDHALS